MKETNEKVNSAELAPTPDPPGRSSSDLLYLLNRNFKKTYCEDIKCPYCGWIDRDSWEHRMNDGDEIEIDCGKCEKTFRVNCSVSRTYESSEI